MAFRHRWQLIGMVAAAVMTSAMPAHAGGVNFGEDSDTNDGPSYFGFVRDDGG